MKLRGRARRLWLWWGEAYWTLAGLEFELPQWPWRLYCLARGHDVTDDQCGRPEHRFCAVCWRPTPGRAVRERSDQRTISESEKVAGAELESRT